MDVFVCVRSFITDSGAVTAACHVTATQWAPPQGHVTLRAASASANPVWLADSVTCVTIHLLRSHKQAVKVNTVPIHPTINPLFSPYLLIISSPAFLSNLWWLSKDHNISNLVAQNKVQSACCCPLSQRISRWVCIFTSVSFICLFWSPSNALVHLFLEGTAIRHCDGERGWLDPDLYNCTSPPFVELNTAVRNYTCTFIYLLLWGLFHT